MDGEEALWNRRIAIASSQAAEATDDSPPTYHYILIRRDIDLGRLGAQITHASRESSKGQDFPRSTRAVVLGIEGEQQMLELEQKLLAAGIKHVAIREPDPPFFGAITAIGLVPQQRSSAINKLTGGLKLLK